jgi:thiol-disulfide isomerase/thioredoxin
MKFYFMLIVLILLNGFSILSAQNFNNYNITLNPSAYYNIGDTIILKVNYLKINDTLIARQQIILFQGSVQEPADAFLKINDKQFYFPIVNDNILITIENADSIKVTYETSRVNDNVSSYYQMADEYIRDFHSLENYCYNLPVKEPQMIFESKLDSLAVTFLLELYEEYKGKSNVEGLSLILPDMIGLIGTRNRPAEIEMIYGLLPDSIRRGSYGKQVQNFLDQFKKSEIGQEVDFAFMTIDSKPYSIKEFQDKYVLLVYWATWCGPCLAEIPMLKDIYTQYSNELEIVSISVDKDIAKWKSKSEQLVMPWINIHYLQNSVDLKELFFVGPIPYTVLLSRNGKILEKNIEISQLESILNN